MLENAEGFVYVLTAEDSETCTELVEVSRRGR